MAFLTKEERDALLDEIKDLPFNQIKGRVRSKDKKSRLAYYRNVQESGKWMTRYILPSLGTMVTLVETLETNDNRTNYRLTEIIVQPTPDNRL
jgi:hypothetical protein